MYNKILLEKQKKQTIALLNSCKKFIKPLLLSAGSIICWAGIFYVSILLFSVIVAKPIEALQEIQRDYFVFVKISIYYAFFLFIAFSLTYFSLKSIKNFLTN